MKFVVAIFVYIVGIQRAISLEDCFSPAVCGKPGVTEIVWMRTAASCEKGEKGPKVDPDRAGVKAEPGGIDSLTLKNVIEGFETSMDEKLAKWRNDSENMVARLVNESEARRNKKMESTINRLTTELETSVRQNFTRWRNSAESEMDELKANLISKGNELEATMQENFIRWKSSAESKVIEMKADLDRKDAEIRSLKSTVLPGNCEEFGVVTEGSGGVAHIIHNRRPYEVYCDMTTDGGNWTVFQRRMDGSVDFYRTWGEYASGFGNKSGEFWLGLETIYQLTKDGSYELRVDLTDWDGSTAYALYRTFSISGRSDGYRLTIGGYSGTAGNTMGSQYGQPFSAKDKDLDSWKYNCATRHHSSWWFSACAWSTLNGRYNDTSDNQNGVSWYHWRGWRYSLKGSEMKFRKK